MPDVRISIDEPEFQALLKEVEAIPGAMRVAASTALNKSAAKGKTSLVKRMVQELTLGEKSWTIRKAVGKRIWVEKATRERLEAALRLKGDYGVALTAFKARQTASGVVARIFGQSRQFPHAFIRTGINQNLHVFVRQGAKRRMAKGHYVGKLRQPLASLKGPAVADTFEHTPGLAAQTVQELNATLKSDLASQVAWLLARNDAANLAKGMAKGGHL